MSDFGSPPIPAPFSAEQLRSAVLSAIASSPVEPDHTTSVVISADQNGAQLHVLRRIGNSSDFDFSISHPIDRPSGFEFGVKFVTSF